MWLAQILNIYRLAVEMLNCKGRADAFVKPRSSCRDNFSSKPIALGDDYPSKARQMLRDPIQIADVGKLRRNKQRQKWMKTKQICK